LLHTPVSCVSAVWFGGQLLPLAASERVERFLKPVRSGKAGGR
jgi:hypothetical protein